MKMKKAFLHRNIHFLAFALILFVVFLLLPQGTLSAEEVISKGEAIQSGLNLVGIDVNIGDVATDILLAPFGWIFILILQLTTLVTWLGGAVLNEAVRFTVLEMTPHISIDTIDATWSKIRDLANMTFIFILLYAAIRTILGLGDDVKKLIVKVVVVAILINFSLFFTKLVIDASNVLALTFYQAIVPDAFSTDINTGISGALMKPLEIQSLWEGGFAISDIIKGKALVTVGVFGSIVALVAGFVFFAMAVMLVIRFVVLIFVMILSPLAFAATILPSLKEQTTKWKDALIGQAVFAPIFFILMWITLTVASGLFPTSGGSFRDAFLGSIQEDTSVVAPDNASIKLILKFIILIALYIATLAISRSWANKAGPMAGNATKFLTGFAGGAIFGGIGAVGRQTVGRFGTYVAERPGLQRATQSERLLKRTGARMLLYGGKKAREGTFDPRRATIPTSMYGDLIRGTIGRTKMGKMMGMDDVNIPGVRIGSLATGQTGMGEGTTKGFRERREESRKRVREREAVASSELAMAEAERDVSSGAKDGATADEKEKMSQALTKLSEKQLEALVVGNRDLVNKLEFANRISAKQLETLNKSEQLSEEEKNNLKNLRFGTFEELTALLASGPAGVDTVGKKVRGWSDSELEMINPRLLGETAFVEQLKPGQIEAINKSPRFTSQQKGNLRTARRQPLLDALTARDVGRAQRIVRSLGHKEIAGLDIAELTHPTMLQTYTPQLLKRMMAEMNPGDIDPLRAAIIGAGAPAATWLGSPDGAVFS